MSGDVPIVKQMNWLSKKIELGPRLGEYIRAREQGASAAHATFLGQEVTTDFRQHGDDPRVQALNATIPFFSSMLASSDRFYRALREPDQRVAVATKLGNIAVMSLMLQALNRHDPAFDKLPDWDRYGYWHIPSPDGQGWVRIPKAWEVGAIGSASELLYDKLSGAPSAKDKWFAVEIAKIAAQNFSVGLGPLQVPVEQWANKNWYTDAPLEPPGLQDLQPWQRATSSTSPTLKALGKLERNSPVQLSPARAEALIRGVFSYYGQYGLWASDHLFFPGTTDLHWDDEPVVSSFYERKGKYDRTRDQFYELLDLTNQAHASMNRAMRGGDDQIAREIGDRPEAAVALALTRAGKVLSGLDKELQSIASDQTLSAAEKRKLYDDKTRERDSLMQQSVDLARRAGVKP